MKFIRFALAAAIATATIAPSLAQPCKIGIGQVNGPDSSGPRPIDLNGLAPSCGQADAVALTLPNGKSKSFSKTSDASRGDKYWRGMAYDDGSTFEYIRDDRGKVFGSVVDLTDGTVTQIAVDGKGDPFVTVKDNSAFPDEADPLDDDEELEDRALFEVSHSDQFNRALADDGSVIDVMVVWTAKAECRNSGLPAGCTRTATTEANIRSRINLAITETNTAYDSSGVNTQLNLVHAYLHPTYVEASSNAFSAALSAARSTNDGVMDDIHPLREQYAADMVAVIIDDAQYCGIANVGPSKTTVFSVTAWNCATGYYSFGHELGHNFGCLHDRGTQNACTTTGYSYGYRDPQSRFRSILAYSCRTGQCDNNPGGTCSRVQMFSNPSYLYNGSPIGNASNDCARRINDVRATVAAYYQSTVATAAPSDAPSTAPSVMPSTAPSDMPSTAPSDMPSTAPSGMPSTAPSGSGTTSPSESPAPSLFPSVQPSSTPSATPSTSPSDMPSNAPSEMPSDAPSVAPSEMPSSIPSDLPSMNPSESLAPSPSKSESPSTVPSFTPTSVPSAMPSSVPSFNPSSNPSTSPSMSPSISMMPSSLPTVSPTPGTKGKKGKKTDSPTLSPTTASPTISAAPTKNPKGNKGGKVRRPKV